MFRLTLSALTLAILSHSSFQSTVDNTLQQSESHTCNSQQVDNDASKIICVCNKQIGFGGLKFEWPQEVGQASFIQSSKAGLRFNISQLSDGGYTLPSNYDKLESSSIVVNLNLARQPILGWGGAFTDATGLNLRNLSEDVADELIESYYGENGLEYNFGRVPLGGSDFSTRPYSYDDSNQTDYELAHWSLAKEDLEYKIPYIRKAIAVAKKSNVDLKLFSSPWSPPKWMKTSNSLVRGSLISDDKIYKSYAEYLMKFFDAYKEHGINFWGATVQNEPISAFLPVYFFNSLYFTNDQMIKFISKYLGPALVARGYTKDKFKLMIGDDSLGFINAQVPAVMADKDVQKYVAGIAFHWYFSGTVVPYYALDLVYNAVKDKIEFMIMSEACAGSGPFGKHVDLGNWDRAEAYASDIIEDLLRQTSSWIDWNMALDQQGGPNWVRNFVDSPIIVNGAKNEFYKQPMYYALAHFSKFFKAGSVRVETEFKDKRWGLYKDLMSVAVYNKFTNHVVVNILNTSTDKRRVNIVVQGGNSTDPSKVRTIVVDGKSVNSIVLKL